MRSADRNHESGPAVPAGGEVRYAVRRTGVSIPRSSPLRPDGRTTGWSPTGGGAGPGGRDASKTTSGPGLPTGACQHVGGYAVRACRVRRSSCCHSSSLTTSTTPSTRRVSRAAISASLCLPMAPLRVTTPWSALTRTSEVLSTHRYRPSTSCRTSFTSSASDRTNTLSRSAAADDAAYDAVRRG